MESLLNTVQICSQDVALEFRLNIYGTLEWDNLLRPTCHYHLATHNLPQDCHRTVDGQMQSQASGWAQRFSEGMDHTGSWRESRVSGWAEHKRCDQRADGQTVQVTTSKWVGRMCFHHTRLQVEEAAPPIPGLFCLEWHLLPGTLGLWGTATCPNHHYPHCGMI